MARYTGPTDKISRRFGVPLFGPSKALERRSYPPGQHGMRGARRKNSEYSVALAEKQKLRFQYGVLEKQFRRYFAEASRRRGVTGTILLQLLETRLDNVVFRLGLANTRRAARQLVNHGHVMVNGHRVDISSCNVRPSDKISLGDNPRSQQLGQRALELTTAVPVPDWLVMDRERMEGSMSRIPLREDINPIVNEQLVVELYSR